MTITRWRCSNFSREPQMVEFDGETERYYLKGGCRTAKSTRYQQHFETKEQAQQAIDERLAREAEVTRLAMIRRAAPELLGALELVTEALKSALTGGQVSAAEAGRALVAADEAISLAKVGKP